MNRSLISLTALVVALFALLPIGGAWAAEITYQSVVGYWRDPVDNVPGSQPGDPVITNGDPVSSINWGTTTGSQSGYDFIATLPPPFELPGPIPFFSLGDFQHRNFEVNDPSLTSVELDVVLMIAVDGVPTGPLTFTFTFNHEETPNNPTPPDTCPYPTPPGDGCTDRVTIVASADPTTFNVDGVDYTLEMTFLDDEGNPVDEFITNEGGTVNSSGLAGEFTLPPGLRVTKSGPTSLRLAEWGDFILDVQNDGDSDAHDVTLLDLLPDGADGGMCDATPEIQSAQVFAPDGVTPAPGKGPLSEGTDYSLVYDSSTCELTLNTLSADAVIAIDERLVIAYRTQLDTDSQDGVTLTNVAGATAWFSDAASNPDRISYLRSLTDGTVGVVDHEDAHNVTVDLPELRFEKTVANVTRGEDPATLAAPGDTLRYSLYVENLSDVSVSGFRIVDVLDDLNDPPAFAPGTLSVITAPASADLSGTDAAGGAAGTGMLDIGSLDIGGAGETVLIEFEAELAPVIADERFVYNQSELLTGGIQIAVSDDPNINGQADPTVADDEDPTRVQIESAPYFDVDKISTYLDGDPNVLLAGERLRYTISVKNVGSENASDTRLVDSLPINTAYVAGSTTLNGVVVPDGGGFPLEPGIDIHAPEDPTAGAMRADATPGADNVATIEFDVRVDADVEDGTVISNQAFVSALDGGVADQPSDDPRTEVPDDPTQDVVGNYPLIFAAKSAALHLDYDSPGIVDPGDTLRYTITVYNNSDVVEATYAALQDSVPAYTTYVADSTTLNGEAVGLPDDGVFPLLAGLPISSQDLTPPAPGEGEGVLNPGQSATIEFDLLVDADTPRGTLIVNQAEVNTEEVPVTLTDGDGNPATGPEPTVVVVGDGQQLSITKGVTVLDGGPAVGGATLDYIVRVRNIGAVPAYDVVITDDLDYPVPDQLTFVPDSATMNGFTDDIVIVGPLLTADYSTANGPLQPGEEILVRFRAVIYDQAPIGTTVTNRADVTWNTDQTASASVSIDIGGSVGSGSLLGSVWHDADFDNVRDPDERRLEDWVVELYRNDQLVDDVETDGNGAYEIFGIAPNYLTDDTYHLRFVAPGASSRTALLGEAYSEEFTTGLHEIRDIEVRSGSFILNQDLPIDPNGVVYNTLTRTTLAEATVTLTDEAGVPVPESCFDDPNQQNQVTSADGYYKFDLNFGSPACPSGATYAIQVAMPGDAFVAGYSEASPPASDPTAPLNVPACPGSADDAVIGTLNFCEAQASPFAPSSQAQAGSGALYFVHLVFDDTGTPGSSQIFNNHIPVDPALYGVVAVTKTTPMVNVKRGQLIPYTITVNSSYEIDLADVDVVDRFPPGFRYIDGSARLDGEPLEPVLLGGELVWEDLTLDAEGSHTIELLLGVGTGVSEGEFVNRAYAISSFSGGLISAEATATVRLVPDPTFDCTDVIGKVYDDENRNGVQDQAEPGIANARVVTARGLTATTDAHGRFHFTCPMVPNETRGTNFVLKLDDRSLPSGYRSSTDMVRVQRATRGKTLRFSFGASIHRVVGLDIADALFEPGTTEIRPQWMPRFAVLIEELQKSPATLRLSYLADVEPPKLVRQRMRAVERRIADTWAALECCYRLEIEPHVFWRLGAPAEQAVQQAAQAGGDDDS